MGEIPNRGVLCPNCGKYYNPLTGHTCGIFSALETARFKLEAWLGPNYKIRSTGD